MGKSENLTLIDALEAATETDLERIREEIDQQTRRLDALKAMAKILEVRIHGKPATTSPGPSDGRDRRDERRQQIFDWLDQHGPATAKAIGAALGIPNGSMTSLMSHPWFEHTPEGWQNARTSPRAA